MITGILPRVSQNPRPAEVWECLKRKCLVGLAALAMTHPLIALPVFLGLLVVVIVSGLGTIEPAASQMP